MAAEQLQLIEVEKRCTKCGIVKPHAEFNRRTPNGKASDKASKARRRASIAINCTLTASDWAEILAEDGNACHYCGVAYTADNSPTLDHVVPLSKGGQHTKQNVVSACRSCNCSKGAKLDWINDNMEVA